MEGLLIVVFVLGYLAITLEHPLKIDKAASAMITGVLCWTIYVTAATDYHEVVHNLEAHLGEISGILFFLLGAMTIVELIDAHDGFEILTDRIKTTEKRRLLWLVCFITFFLSAALDNLTTTIVMISLVRKLIADRNDRIFFAGLIVVAANAGGAWSPLGDVTTTMLWIGGQITVLNIITMLLIPSLICLLAPLLLIAPKMTGHVQTPERTGASDIISPARERNIVFGLGLGSLLFVPVFKTLTHLPPFMGMLLGLGVMWVVTELIHSEKDEREKGPLSVLHALRKIDTPSILFFLGILMAVAALQSTGLLSALAGWLDRTIQNTTLIVLIIGFLSAIVDNVPLVAAAQGMYSLEQFPVDNYFWEFLAYCTGTGGSALIIGSAAGVAAMGIENIRFGWYLRRITIWAVLGYLAGAAAYVLQYNLLH
ncbi:MAG: sodium:proton antiporter NhaD [Lewinellaceae bacterium]|nr:sodium:proton antiporter NhaD [Saprospiraceae bacterium]MCB9332539.1 sodium:proton antiporter NhaD [Lewinellaceae bacterium]